MKTKNLMAIVFSACVVSAAACTPPTPDDTTVEEAAEQVAELVVEEEGSGMDEAEEPTTAPTDGAEAAAAEGDTATVAVVGAPAPAFTLTDEAGNQHTLADYAGKTVVLEWVNPECPYVVRHYAADTMETTSAGFGDDVVWLAINSSHFITPEDAQAFKTAEGFDYPVLLDADGTVGHAYGARTTPHMYVIDTEGVLAYAGAIDDDPRGSVPEPTNHVVAAVAALQQGARPDPSSTDPYGCSVKYN